MAKALGKVVGFQVSYQGNVLAKFETKEKAIAFTKAGAVYTEQFGWLVRPSGAAQASGSLVIDPVCEITPIRAA